MFHIFVTGIFVGILIMKIHSWASSLYREVLCSDASDYFVYTLTLNSDTIFYQDLTA